MGPIYTAAYFSKQKCSGTLATPRIKKLIDMTTRKEMKTNDVFL